MGNYISIESWTEGIGVTIGLIYIFIVLLIFYFFIPYFQNKGLKCGCIGVATCVGMVILFSYGIKSLNNYNSNVMAFDSHEIEILIVASRDVVIQPEQLKELNEDDLDLLLNGIFAYNGYKFSDPYYESFFQNFDWYDPRYNADQFDAKTMLSATQQETIANIWNLKN